MASLQFKGKPSKLSPPHVPFLGFLPNTHEYPPSLFPPLSPARGDTPRTDPILCPPHQRTTPSNKRLEPNVWHRVSPRFAFPQTVYFTVFKDTLTRHVELTSFINIHLPQFAERYGENTYRSGLHVLAQLMAFFSTLSSLSFLPPPFCSRFFLPLSLLLAD